MSEALTTTTINKLMPYTANDVNRAWDQANNGMRAIIEFGAMLANIEDCISEYEKSWVPRHPAQKNQHSEYTLKSWLEENCPAINYNTAKGYKRLATIAAQSLQMTTGDLYMNIGGAPAEGIQMSKDEKAKTALINQYLTGSTRRSILNDWATSGGKPGAVKGARKAKSPVEETPEAYNARMDELARASITNARNILVELNTNVELKSRLDATLAKTLLIDIKKAVQGIAEAIA